MSMGIVLKDSSGFLPFSSRVSQPISIHHRRMIKADDISLLQAEKDDWRQIQMATWCFGLVSYSPQSVLDEFANVSVLTVIILDSHSMLIGSTVRLRRIYFPWAPGMKLTYSGFPKGALNEAYDQCKTVFDGTVASCPYFAKFENAEADRDCQADGHIVNEVSW